MTSENPYQSPPPVSPVPDRILVRNYNQAGGPLAIALVIGPMLVAGMLWLVTNGGPRNTPLEGRIVILTLMGLGEIAALVYALRVPVLWVEIGPTLRYGSLAAVHEVEWDGVQRIWFDREDERAWFGPLSVTLSANHALVIQINDYKDLRVLVPADKLELLRSMLSRHPRFKDSPFDEEPIASPDVDDDASDD